MPNYRIAQNNGQDLTICCTEVRTMSQPNSNQSDLQKKLALAMERQINEQLYQQKIITKEMYEAAKQSFEYTDSEKERNVV